MKYVIYAKSAQLNSVFCLDFEFFCHFPTSRFVQRPPAFIWYYGRIWPVWTGNSRFGIWFFTWPLLCRRCLFIRSLCNSRPNWFCSPAGHTCFLFLSFAQWQLFRQKVLTLATRQIVFILSSVLVWETNSDN